jgi:hypothetical protein
MKHFGDLSFAHTALICVLSDFSWVGVGGWGYTRGGLGADNLLLGAMFICSGMFDEPKLQKKLT